MKTKHPVSSFVRRFRIPLAGLAAAVVLLAAGIVFWNLQGGSEVRFAQRQRVVPDIDENIIFTAEASPGIVTVEWYVDGKRVGEGGTPTFRFAWPPRAGNFVIEARGGPQGAEENRGGGVIPLRVQSDTDPPYVLVICEPRSERFAVSC